MPTFTFRLAQLTSTSQKQCWFYWAVDSSVWWFCPLFQFPLHVVGHWPLQKKWSKQLLELLAEKNSSTWYQHFCILALKPVSSSGRFQARYPVWSCSEITHTSWSGWLVLLCRVERFSTACSQWNLAMTRREWRFWDLLPRLLPIIFPSFTYLQKRLCMIHMSTVIYDQT